MEPVVSHLGPLPLLQVQLVIGCVRRSHLCNALKVTRSGQQVSRFLDSPWRQPKSEVTGDPNNTEMTDSDTYIGRAAFAVAHVGTIFCRGSDFNRNCRSTGR